MTSRIHIGHGVAVEVVDVVVDVSESRMIGGYAERLDLPIEGGGLAREKHGTLRQRLGIAVLHELRGLWADHIARENDVLSVVVQRAIVGLWPTLAKV